MLLLGHDWTGFTMPDQGHVVSVSWAEAGYWWWECTCQRHEGYSKNRENIVAAARRHAQTAPVSA